MQCADVQNFLHTCTAPDYIPLEYRDDLPNGFTNPCAFCVTGSSFYAPKCQPKDSCTKMGDALQPGPVKTAGFQRETMQTVQSRTKERVALLLARFVAATNNRTGSEIPVRIIVWENLLLHFRRQRVAHRRAVLARLMYTRCFQGHWTT